MKTSSGNIASPEPVVTAARAWSVVGILWVGWVISYIDRQVAFSIFPALRRDLGFSSEQLGLIGTIFIWVYSICSPLVGRLADVARRELLVAASLALWSLTALATGLTGSVGGFLFWRGAMGVTEAIYQPTALSIIGSVQSPAVRSRAVAIYCSGQMTGIVVGGWFGGWMADQWSWRNGYIALAIGGILYAPVLWLALGRVPRPAQSAAASLPSEIFSARCYRALLAAFFALCVMLWMLYAWLPSYIYERFGLSMAASGFAATAYLQASTITGMLCGGALADWTVRRVRAGRFYIAGAGLLMAAPFAYLTLATPSLPVLKLASAAFGLFAGMMVANVFASAYDVISARNYGFAAGVLNMTGGLSGGAATFLAGRWKESLGIHTLMGGGALAAVFSAVILMIVASKEFARDRQRIGMPVSLPAMSAVPAKT
jgi:MFS family permease